MKKRINRQNISFNIMRTKSSIELGACTMESTRHLLTSDVLKDCKKSTYNYIEGAYSCASKNNLNGALYCLEMAAKQEYLFGNIWTPEDFLFSKSAKEMFSKF